MMSWRASRPRNARPARRRDLFLQLAPELADETGETHLTFALQLLGAQDRFHGFEGDADIVVDDDIVVGVEMAHLVARLLHLAADDFFGVLRARVQALLERER